jgi:hypothetical protein
MVSAAGASRIRPLGKATDENRNEAFVREHGEWVSAGNGDDLFFRNSATRYLIWHVSNFDNRSDANAHLTVMHPAVFPITSSVSRQRQRIRQAPKSSI